MKKLQFMLFFILLSCRMSAAPLSGNYYIPNQSVGQNGYISLSAAINDLNANGMSGNVTFYINGNVNETGDIRLGVNTQDYTLTIKPQENTKPVINLQNGDVTPGDATVITGSFIIGSPTGNKTNMVYTKNLIIDGSNTVGGTSRDLVIQGPITTNQKSVIAVFGDNDNVTVKNCIIINNSANSSANACFIVTNYVTLNEDQTVNNFSPDNLTIQNNELYSLGGRSSDGIYINNNGGTPTAGMNGLIVDRNIVSANYRGIRVSYVDDAKICNNTISVNTIGSNNASGIMLEPLVNDTEGTIDIYNNKLVTLKTLNSSYANNNGIIGIDCEYILPKNVNIYNNTVSLTGPSIETSKDSRIYGIRSTGNATCNIYHNTVHIPEMLDMTNFGRSSIAGIVFGGKGDVSPIGGFTTVKNNIVVGEETLMKYWCILRIGTSGMFTSENNILSCKAETNGYLGYYNASDTKSLSEWVTASGQDINSKNKYVSFTDPTSGNLFLAESSIGDKDLAVPYLAEVSTDILGNARHTPFTYAGAHEPNKINTAVLLIQDDNSVFIETTSLGINVRFNGNAFIEVYGINGVLVDKVNTNSNYSKKLDKGIYIIRINNKVAKLII